MNVNLLSLGLHPKLFATLPLGLITLDRQGLIMHINPAAEAMTGILRAGTLWGQAARHIFQHRHNDGHEVSLRDGRRIHISTCPLPDKTGQLVILQDLTASHQLKDSLNRQKRLDSMGHLLAALAHQLRTPLTTSMLQVGNLEWLQQGNKCPASQKALTSLQQELETIEQKISDILLFAKGEKVLHDLLSVNDFLHELRIFCARENWKNLNIHWKAIDHTVDQPESLILHCNRNVLLSAISNLLNNALEAGATTFNLTCGINDQNLILTFDDNGPGLSEQEQQKVLEPFYTTKATGTGLGLPVVRLVTETHSGQLNLTDSPEKGLRIVMTLPLQQKNQTTPLGV